jgi:hypothetical protein
VWQNKLALDYTHSQIAYVGYEGTIFHVSGPFAPILGAQTGVIVKSISGIDPPFKMLDNRGARQDGTTWYDALYDPGLINMMVDIGGVNAADFRKIMRAWWGAWDPRQVGKLCWFSPERGEWWALARLAKPVPEIYKEDFYESFFTTVTWTIQNDNAFWFGPASVCQVSANNQVQLADNFVNVYPGGLSPSWNQLTTGPGAIASLGTGRAAWVPSGTTTGTAIAEWTASESTSDDQIVSLVIDGDMPATNDTMQTITLNQPVAGGTFTLTLSGQTTQPIAYGADAGTVELNLEALSTIGVNNVVVASAEGGVFDAVGAGFVGNNANPTYLHNIGTHATTIVAFVDVFTDTAIPSVTAWVGGVNQYLMTLQGIVDAYATDGLGGYASLFAFVLELPPGAPTGSTTMAFQIGGATTFQVAVNSISYNLVTLAGIATQAFNTTANPTMTQPFVTPGQIVCQAFGGYHNAMTAYTGGTQRDNRTFSAGSNMSFVMGDAITTGSSDTFGVTMASGPWAGISIPLYSPNQSYTATFVGAKANQVVPAMTGSTSWNGASGITISSMQAGVPCYIDLWGRMNNTGTVGLDGVRARFGFQTAVLSVFNAGTEFVLWSGTCNGPFDGDQLSLQCGVVSPSQAQLDQLLYGANYTQFQYQIFQNGFPLIPFGNINTLLQQWFGLNYGYTDTSGHGLAGPSYRAAGFGMQAGGNGTRQVVPPPVSQFNAGAGTPFITLTNIGDQPGFPSYLCYGPGTFLINDVGTNSMISFGPLLPGQIALLNTNPRLAPVVDLTPPAISPAQLTLFQQLNVATTEFLQFLVDLVTNNNLPPLMEEWQSLFGQQAPQGPLTSLLTSRFTQAIPPMLEQKGPVSTFIPCQIQGGSDQSKIVASLTPMRRWPE